MTNKVGNDLQDILNKITKEQGKSLFLGDLPKRGLVPFSSPFLNEATRGGYPRGVPNEIVGEEHTGKTTLALDLLKHYQKISEEEYEEEKKALKEEVKKAKGKKLTDLEEELDNLKEKLTVYLDLEYALNPKWAESVGVDMSRVIVYQPPAMGAEDALDSVVEMIQSDQVGALVIDSVGVMISSAEEKKDIGEGNFGGISKSLTKFYKKATPYFNKNNIFVVILNHTRADMAGYGQLVRPGGKAHAFAQSSVLRLRPSSQHIYEQNYKKGSGNSPSVWAKGISVQVNKLKQESARIHNTVYTIRVGKGIDTVFDTLNFSIQIGDILSGGGGNYTFCDPATGEEIGKARGIINAYMYLYENKELFDRYWQACYNYSITDIEGDI